MKVPNTLKIRPINKKYNFQKRDEVMENVVHIIPCLLF